MCYIVVKIGRIHSQARCGISSKFFDQLLKIAEELPKLPQRIVSAQTF